MSGTEVIWMFSRWAHRFGLLLIATAVLLGVGQAVAAQTAAPTLLYVSPTGADSGTCPQTSPCATVSYALTQAAPGATIKVSGTIKDHLSISSPVTITNWSGGPAGSPGVLSGTGSGIVVNVFASGVTLNQLTIENAAPWASITTRPGPSRSPIAPCRATQRAAEPCWHRQRWHFDHRRQHDREQLRLRDRRCRHL